MGLQLGWVAVDPGEEMIGAAEVPDPASVFVEFA